MTNMRRGFTMIELIFVIVIIGILAAVAIPKLAATRDDARISNIIANTRTTLGDMTAYYTAQGNARWIDDTITTASIVSNVPLGTDCTGPTPTEPVAGGVFVLCDDSAGQACITISPDANGSVVNIESTGGTTICDGVAGDPAIQAIVGGAAGSNRDHPLGGASVQR